MRAASDHNKPQVTRGFGLLENILSKRRSRKANALIPDSLRGGRLLDIGCGAYPFFLLNTTFAGKYGIDQAPGIPHWKEFFSSDPTFHLQQGEVGNGKELPFDSDFFEVVTMQAVFEHIEPAYLRPLVMEIHRVLKSGGLFILTVPPGWTDRLLRLMARLKLVSTVEINDHKDTYSPRKISGILQDGRFKKENIRVGYFNLYTNMWGRAQK